MTTRAARLLRDRSGAQRVTNIELFFDLVYVFAITQLSRHLAEDATVEGALQAALLLAMVWLCWAYTAWVTNWMDPDHLSIRLLIVSLTLVSLAMSAALPGAFGAAGGYDRGWLVGGCYALSQIGRSVFMVIALRGDPLQRNFQRILAWTLISGGLAIAGGISHGDLRELLWVLAAGTDVAGGLAGFWVPVIGRSRTTDWTISGGHFAERCSAFILIALGESIVSIGETASGVHAFTAANVTAFVIAFLGTVALYWIYFDRSAQAAAATVERSKDPGRLGRSAYHLIHPVMVAGIIVVAAADENLAHPAKILTGRQALLTLGGPALFLAGNAAFKAVIWHVIPWSRIAGIVALGLLGFLATSVPEQALAALTLVVVLAVAAHDRLAARTPEAT